MRFVFFVGKMDSLFLAKVSVRFWWSLEDVSGLGHIHAFCRHPQWNLWPKLLNSFWNWSYPLGLINTFFMIMESSVMTFVPRNIIPVKAFVMYNGRRRIRGSEEFRDAISSRCKFELMNSILELGLFRVLWIGGCGIFTGVSRYWICFG